MDLIEYIKSLEVDDAIKTELTTKATEFKSQANGEDKLDRIKLENELATEKKSVDTLKGLNKELQTKLDGVGGENLDVDKKVTELQLKLDKAIDEKSILEGTIGEYKNKDTKREMDKYVKTVLSDVSLNLPEEFIVQEFSKSLVPNANGGYLAKDVNGQEILVDTFKTQFVESYKQYIPAAGSDNGMSGENTNSTTNSTTDSKKPAPIKDLIPDAFK